VRPQVSTRSTKADFARTPIVLLLVLVLGPVGESRRKSTRNLGGPTTKPRHPAMCA
jgi:hypothetical protein